MSAGNEIDRASWQRFSANNKDRCMICGHTGVVSIALTATELQDNAGRGGSRPQLAKQALVFCDIHGTQRYAGAIAYLRTGSSNVAK